MTLNPYLLLVGDEVFAADGPMALRTPEYVTFANPGTRYASFGCKQPWETLTWAERESCVRLAITALLDWHPEKV